MSEWGRKGQESEMDGGMEKGAQAEISRGKSVKQAEEAR